MKIASIEVARGIAIFCIILIHTGPFLGSDYTESKWMLFGQFIQQISSFAVPLFFMVAGYFFSLGIEKRGLLKQLKNYISRIFFLLIVWIIIDGFFWGEWLGKIIKNGTLRPLFWNLMAVPGFAMNRPDLFIFRGTAVPLWFLVSLIIGILFLSLTIRFNFNNFVKLLLAFTGYVLTLSTSYYHNTLIGLEYSVPLEQRGIGIAFFFLTIGHLAFRGFIFEKDIAKTLMISVLLMFIESFLLSKSNNQIFSSHQYLLSTPLVAYTLFIALLNNPSFGLNSFLYKIGERSLGIYLVHTPILSGVRFIKNLYNHPLLEILFPIIILLTSLTVILILNKIPYLRKIVA